ncbi:polysaccharide deacetylase family protein [Maribacter algarum]|nr:polysaccharide deacetylase family protein [Maribacter algarum]
MKHIFTRTLGIDVTFTTKVEDFIKHSGAKVTYTKQPLQNEFFIRSNDLLFEQGINDIQISVSDWEGVPCFFTAGERSTIPFDIFSASFYLLSRYEEYLPHVKDMHGRFPPKESIAYQNGFLQQPVVDIWAFKLLAKLKERFPNLEFKKRAYKYTSVMDVTTSHGFAHRGFTRSVAGLLYDLGSFKLRRVGRRIGVWFNPKKDPFDNYGYLINLHKKFTVKSMFFFQFASYSTYDKNLSPNNNRFKFLIKSIADYSTVALAASYSSFEDIILLKNEKKRLSDVINRDVTSSRMRYNRVDVPNTYRNLVDAEFTDDYTMGYTHEIGFRAGTCTPFYFYDINLELQQPIRVHPFAFHDYALVSMASKEEISQKISALYQRVKNVNGDFTSVFSIELLGGQKSRDWKILYESVLSEFHV